MTRAELEARLEELRATVQTRREHLAELREERRTLEAKLASRRAQINELVEQLLDRAASEEDR